MIHSVAMALISKQLFIFSLQPKLYECRNTLLSKIFEINSDLITRNDLALIETLLFGDNSFSQYDNSKVVDATIAVIVTSKRFDDPLPV